MVKISTDGNYDFYSDGDLFNIVPAGSPPPAGGYRRKDYIEKIKGVQFPNTEEMKK